MNFYFGCLGPGFYTAELSRTAIFSSKGKKSSTPRLLEKRTLSLVYLFI